jgi:hypothetical protein
MALARIWYRLYCREQMSTLFATSQRVGRTIARLPVAPLSESTMAELRLALTEQLKKPDALSAELSELLQGAAREARSANIRPEELLLVFKQLWNSLNERMRPHQAEQCERVRERLVTVCIKAYYAE